MKRGLVICCAGSSYTVRTDDGAETECRVKGSFRLRGIRSTNPVAVGDRVKIAPAEGADAAYIVEIEERRNCIVRKSPNLSKQSHVLAANLDQALLVVTVAHPQTSATFIDRFLASAEAYRVAASLAFNKTDCLSEEETRVTKALIEVYRAAGYACYACSALTGAGMDALTEGLKDKTTLLSGHSGVGKSTLLNALVPGLSLRTAPLSAAHDTGMHTTTFSRMYDLPQGGSVIDTPGIKGFGTFNFKREEVSHYFREIFRLAPQCKYYNCTHTHEPDCAVRAAVAEGRIAASRYASYLNMLDDPEEMKYRQAY